MAKMAQDETFLESIEWRERAVLTPQERDDVRALAALCDERDGTDLKLAYGEPGATPDAPATCFLAYLDGRLVGYFGADCGDEDEICGMVAPEMRRRGIGEELLVRALARSFWRGQRSVLLITEEAVPGGAALARKMDGALALTELRLGLRAPEQLHADEGRAAGLVKLRPATGDDIDVVAEITATGFDEPLERARSTFSEEMGLARYLVGEVDGRAVGTLKIYAEGGAANGQGDNTGKRAGIYGFAVRPEEQGRGYGRAIFVQTVRLLLDEGYLPVTLEVLRENDRASALYTSAGMRPITTYTYYRLSLASQGTPPTQE